MFAGWPRRWDPIREVAMRVLGDGSLASRLRLVLAGIFRVRAGLREDQALTV